MPKIKKSIKPNSFIDCDDIEENTAVYDFNNNTLKQGEAHLNPKQLERISFLLAHDLKTFAQTNSNFPTLSANVVYTHLKTINKTPRRSWKNFFFFMKYLSLLNKKCYNDYINKGE